MNPVKQGQIEALIGTADGLEIAMSIAPEEMKVGMEACIKAIRGMITNMELEALFSD